MGGGENSDYFSNLCARGTLPSHTLQRLLAWLLHLHPHQSTHPALAITLPAWPETICSATSGPPHTAVPLTPQQLLLRPLSKVLLSSVLLPKLSHPVHCTQLLLPYTRLPSRAQPFLPPVTDSIHPLLPLPHVGLLTELCCMAAHPAPTTLPLPLGRSSPPLATPLLYIIYQPSIFLQRHPTPCPVSSAPPQCLPPPSTAASSACSHHLMRRKSMVSNPRIE